MAGGLDRAPDRANRLTRAMLEETCDRLVGQAKMTTSVAGDVYQLLMLSSNRLPSVQAAARRLGMTERTLRRRLSANARQNARDHLLPAAAQRLDAILRGAMASPS